MTVNNKRASLQILHKYWPILYVIVVTGLLFAWYADWAYDDPFITYRYAQNLVNGHGFVYNPGQRVQSTTTPLFSILLAGLSLIWDDIPRLANLISVLSLAAGALLLWDLAYSWKTPAVGIAALLLYPTFPLLLATTGSETPIYIALCLASFALYARRMYKMTAVACAMAVLTRPDGLLVPAIIALDYLLRVRRPFPWKPVGIFLALTLPWFIFAWLYFGSPLPDTLAAKQGQGLMAISERFAPGLLTTARPYLLRWQYRIETVLATAGLLYLIWKSKPDQTVRRWWTFLAWPFLYFIAFSLLGVSRYFWYYAPLIPGFLVLVGLGAAGIIALTIYIAASLTRRLFGDEISNKSFTSLLGFGILFILVAILAVSQILQLNTMRLEPNGRYLIYHDIGLWLQAHTPQEAKMGTLEVGIIGYFAQRPMLGFAGLIEPSIAEMLSETTTYQDTAIWAVQEFQPPYLILQDGVFPSLESMLNHEQCKTEIQFPGDRYGYQHDITVYECLYSR